MATSETSFQVAPRWPLRWFHQFWRGFARLLRDENRNFLGKKLSKIGEYTEIDVEEAFSSDMVSTNYGNNHLTYIYIYIYIYIYVYIWYLHIHNLFTQSKSRQTMSFDYKAQWGLTFWAFKRSVAVVALDLWMCHSLRCFFLVVGFICIFAWLCHKTTLKLTHPLPACTFESMIFRLKPVWWDTGIGSLECSGLKIQGRAPHLHLLRKRSTYYIPKVMVWKRWTPLRYGHFLVSMLLCYICGTYPLPAGIVEDDDFPAFCKWDTSMTRILCPQNSNLPLFCFVYL